MGVNHACHCCLVAVSANAFNVVGEKLSNFRRIHLHATVLVGGLMTGASFFGQKPFWFRGLGLLGHKEFADFEFQWLVRMDRRLGPLGLLIKLWREPAEDLLDERDLPWWYQPNVGQVIISLLELVERNVGHDQGRSLRGDLETAQYSSEAGSSSVAIASLKLFIKQVQEMIGQNALKAEVGEVLVDLAQKAIKQLTPPSITEDTSS
jgi:hypothetical protein